MFMVKKNQELLDRLQKASKEKYVFSPPGKEGDWQATQQQARPCLMLLGSRLGPRVEL